MIFSSSRCLKSTMINSQVWFLWIFSAEPEMTKYFLRTRFAGSGTLSTSVSDYTIYSYCQPPTDIPYTGINQYWSSIFWQISHVSAQTWENAGAWEHCSRKFVRIAEIINKLEVQNVKILWEIAKLGQN